MGADLPDGNETHKPSDAEVLEKVRATYVRLDRWRMVIASRPEAKSDSALAADDVVWPWAPPTSLCLATLGSAREHLHAIRLLIEAGELFPSVTSTLARSALMSASVAVWMLEPDQASERQRRMLTFALEDYRNHIAFGDQVSRTFHIEDIHPNADEQLSRLRQRSNEVRELLDQRGGPVGWNMTDTIIPAAVNETTTGSRQRSHFESRWRVMSGAAHGFVWPHFGAPGTTVSNVDPAGVGLVTAGGSVGTLAIDYFTAFHVTARGWALFAERSGWHALAS